jgi:hypothetical protein
VFDVSAWNDWVFLPERPKVSVFGRIKNQWRPKQFQRNGEDFRERKRAVLSIGDAGCPYFGAYTAGEGEDFRERFGQVS